jgi:hypothetical protein
MGASSNMADCGAPSFDAAPAGARVDGGGCMILASNYDQSCSVDADCMLVAAGNYCAPGCICREAPISVSASLQFSVDISKTPVALDAMAPPAGCTCLAPAGPCCRSGTCQVGARCQDGGCQ